MPRIPRRRRRKRCPFCQTLLHPHPRLGARQWACPAAACHRVKTGNRYRLKLPRDYHFERIFQYALAKIRGLRPVQIR